MKLAIVLSALLFIVGIALGIAQIWFKVLNVDDFIKAELTIGALLAVVVILIYIVQEYREHKAIKNGDDVDNKRR